MTWIVIGVSSGVPWPKIEGILTFKGHHFTLRPETEALLPSFTFKIPHGMTYDEGMSLCREFMSTLSWVEDAPLEEESVSGGGHPINIGKGPHWRAIAVDKVHIRYLPEVTDQKAKLALALYREAHNVNSVPYKFLGFFKILNIILKTKTEHSNWINNNLDRIDSSEAKKVISTIKRSQNDVGRYLYESGRCAIAHAFDDTRLVNPDDIGHQRRLQVELPVVKALAEHLIEQELGLKSKRTYHREHQYELEGFRHFLNHDLIARLSNGESINLDTPIQLGRISIKLHEQSPFPALCDLKCRYQEAINGSLHLEATSDDALVFVTMRLNVVSTHIFRFSPA